MPRSNTAELDLLINRLGRTALKNLLGGKGDAPVKRRKRRKKASAAKETK